jgi:hypothetical protein
VGDSGEFAGKTYFDCRSLQGEHVVSRLSIFVNLLSSLSQFVVLRERVCDLPPYLRRDVGVWVR